MRTSSAISRKAFLWKTPVTGTVFMFNVLELVYDHRSVISEIHRVLAQGGTAYIWSPFLINIHHHPNDYFRYSEKALEKIMHEAGFSECSIRPFGGLVVIIGTYCGQLVSFLPVLQDVVHALCLPLNALLSRLKKNNRTYWPAWIHGRSEEVINGRVLGRCRAGYRDSAVSAGSCAGSVPGAAGVAYEVGAYPQRNETEIVGKNR